MMSPSAVGTRPPATLPLRYLITAASAFILAALALPALAPTLGQHYYQPRVLALAHTVGLGWITMAIMGASYQLVPVLLERPPWSERLGRWQFVAMTVGVVGMVGHFWTNEWRGFLWVAGAVALAAALHLLNLGLTLRGLTRWNFTARAFVLALAGLGATVLLGLALAANRVWDLWTVNRLELVHAHFHLALLGWVAPMVVGTATRVYPMFLLAPELPRGGIRPELWGLGLGGPLVVAGLLAAPTLVLPGALAAALALITHGGWLVRTLRRRRRAELDWGARLALAGAAFLAPAVVLGLGFAAGLLSGPRLALAYGIVVLGGWVSLTVAGMMLKIVPFLVWYHVYGPRAGRTPVPTLAQLGWPAMERLACGGLVTGVAALALGVAASHGPAIATGSGILAVGALGFAAALGHVLWHLGRGGREARAGARPVGPAVTATRESVRP